MATTKRRPSPKKLDSASDSVFPGGDARIMDVATLVQCRYQRARDLMLARRFGDIRKDKDGKLIVARTQVEAFADEKKRGAGK